MCVCAERSVGELRYPGNASVQREGTEKASAADRRDRSVRAGGKALQRARLQPAPTRSQQQLDPRSVPEERGDVIGPPVSGDDVIVCF
ncbi:hypothetical protein EYF80_013837 [Liparis tanakae]|uniref:Uncharacterized protein n=1 Tax=Liparis tanakae TaxID=230148 RepID=A0A4Z2ID86_9TELE|nr:hypothetical protein EYF80_013837 [Liparis tanakae]